MGYEEIGIGTIGSHRVTIGPAGEVVDATQGLYHMPEAAVVRIGAIPSLRRHTDHNDIRLHRPEVIVGQTPPLHYPAGKALGDHIGPGHQSLGHFNRLRQRQVQGYTVFVGILVIEITTAVYALDAILKGTAYPETLHAGGRLYPDHLGSMIGQVPGGLRPHRVPGEINHLDSG